MPSIEEHCKISLERTKGKKDYRELHEWIIQAAKPYKLFGADLKIVF